MPMYFFVWTDDFVQKCIDRGITLDEVEDVVQNPDVVGVSRSSGLPLARGHASTGRFLIVVYQWADDDQTTVVPVSPFTPDKDY